MTFWTIQFVDANGVTQEMSFPDLAKLEGGKVVSDGWTAQFQSHKSSRLSLRLPGVPPHRAPAIPFESRVKIYSDRALGGLGYSGGTKQFDGFRTDRNGTADPNRSSSSYVFDDEWYFLEHCPFYQTWYRGAVAYPFTNIVLFQPNPGQVYAPAAVGGLISTGQQITDILNWAISQGANLQIGTIDPASYCAVYPVQNLKCAEALRMCLRIHPDCFTEIDYSTNIPTIHVRRRTNLIAIALPYSYTDNLGRRHTATDIQPRPELRPRRVALFYRVISSGYLISTPQDIYPPAVTTGLRALDFAIDLQGPKAILVTAKLTSSAFDPTDLNWWRKKMPSLKDVTQGGQLAASGGGVLTLLSSTINGSGEKDIQVKDDAGNAIDTILTYGFELDPKSSILTWMTGVQVIEATVTAVFRYKKTTTIPGSNQTVTHEMKEHRHHVRVKLVNLPSRNFQFSQFLTTGESTPANLAQNIYTALNQLQYNLTHTVVEKPFNGWIKPGKHAVNLAGGAAEWTTMSATVQSTEYKMRLDGAGATFDNFTVRCGPVEHLEAGQLVQLFNLFNNRDLTKIDTNERVTGQPSPGSTVDMPSDNAQENSVAADPLPVTSHNAYVDGGGAVTTVKNSALDVANNRQLN
ncbi:MAG TPA: hypothetical protein VNN22_24145 [Verrucomicrobiae bacterium]|nr:hypothetical protein [Verrucomicrobiae bacterium]